MRKWVEAWVVVRDLREGVSERWHWSWDLKSKRETALWRHGISFPDHRDSKCKVPEVGKGLTPWRNRKYVEQRSRGSGGGRNSQKEGRATGRCLDCIWTTKNTLESWTLTVLSRPQRENVPEVAVLFRSKEEKCCDYFSLYASPLSSTNISKMK